MRREGLAPMQWPDTTVAEAGTAAGFEVGSAAFDVSETEELAGGSATRIEVLGDLGLPCREDPELFFAESPDDVEYAKSLCRGCPVRLGCLAGALGRREPWGVWGGGL